MTEPEATAAAPGGGRARKAPDSGLSAHILPASATMIGVCMRVLSIGHLGPGGALRAWVDKLLAIDALVFLGSALLSFMSMRSGDTRMRLETRAELVFVAGLGMLALAFAIN